MFPTVVCSDRTLWSKLAVEYHDNQWYALKHVIYTRKSEMEAICASSEERSTFIIVKTATSHLKNDVLQAVLK